jgi:hypothetical protein
MATEKPLSQLAQRYCKFLVADKQRRQGKAARDAGFSDSTADGQASDMMKEPRILAYIAELEHETNRRLEMSADDVLRDAFLVVTADPNELTQHRVIPCRYCHGMEHRYQMTPAEYERDLAAYITLQEMKTNGDVMGLKFNMRGGVGYNKRLKPHPDCPECGGVGESETIIRDTRYLSEAGRAIYAGVKHTKNGPEVKLRDRDASRDLFARYTGIVRNNVELTGKNGGPVRHAGVLGVVAITATDPQEAAKQYQQLMGE